MPLVDCFHVNLYFSSCHCLQHGRCCIYGARMVMCLACTPLPATSTAVWLLFISYFSCCHCFHCSLHGKNLIPMLLWLHGNAPVINYVVKIVLLPLPVAGAMSLSLPAAPWPLLPWTPYCHTDACCCFCHDCCVGNVAGWCRFKLCHCHSHRRHHCHHHHHPLSIYISISASWL